MSDTKRAIIYCRVSSPEQVKGYSLEGQEKECRKFALSNGYEVDRVFIEGGESAKTVKRTELTKLIKYSVENKRRLNAFIIWKLDRLARNLGDQIALIEQFSLLHIRVLSVLDNNEDTCEGQLMRNIVGAFSAYENGLRATRTINGMKQAILKGWWCWRTPIGYTQTKDTIYKTLLVVNQDAPHIIEVFDLFVTGLYTQADIVKKLREKGFKRLTKGLLNRILRNPLYCSLIKVSWFPDFISAIHKPIISQDTFFKAHFILTGKRLSIAPKVRNRPDFPLRNFIRCPVCGEKLTAGWSTGRKGNCSVNVRKEQIETHFYDYLKTLEPKQDTLALFETIVRDTWKNNQQEQLQDTVKIENDLRQLQARKDKVFELLVKGTLDETVYKKETEKVNDEIIAKKMALDERKTELKDIEPCISYCRFVLSSVATLWKDGDLNLRQRFQALIFPKEIFYEQRKFRTAETALIFKHLQPNQTPKLDLVAPTGFEPVFNG